MITGNPLYPNRFKSQNPNFVGDKMRFNLLELHNPEEDTNVRKLLRVYSVIPRFASHDNPAHAEQAIRVNRFLKQINKKLKREVSITWKVNWIKSSGYSFAKRTYVDWFLGRASIPLIALKRLKMFGLKEEVEALIDSCEFFSSTSARPFRIPHEIDCDLAYLLGAILGDGHIRKDGHVISFKVSEKWLAEKFIQKVDKIFEHKLNLHRRLKRDKFHFAANSANKPAVRLFTKFLEVPRGKKSHLIFVPDLIKNASEQIRLAFLEGVFDTEGCIRRKGLRVTSASKQFRDDLCELMISLGEKGWKDEWINKKYNKKYYGLQYSIRNLPFLAGMPEFGQSGQV